jgi:hypothetical protein
VRHQLTCRIHRLAPLGGHIDTTEPDLSTHHLPFSGMPSPVLAYTEAQMSGLERIASAHSSQTASSEAAGSVKALSSASAHTDLMTPTYRTSGDDDAEEELSDNEMNDMYAEADAARRRFAKTGTRSMQSLKQTRGRERSMTDAR